MKIGIITFPLAPNYGAALQAFALQTHLRKIGHDPFFINYHYGLLPRKGLLRWIGRTPTTTIEKIGDHFKLRPFLSFQNEHLNLGCTRFLDHIQLRSNPPAADVYICGSDQVWNPLFLKLEKDEHVFWLDFGDSEVRRIAYAASFGVRELDCDVRSRYAGYAHGFYAIGVREKDGVELVKGIGRTDAVWVPDPTLLLDQSEYLAIEKRPHRLQQSHIFSYQLGIDTTQQAMRINDCVCALLGARCYNVYGASLAYKLFHFGDPSPGEWLSRLRQSRFVVTNSFHATVFSLLFHKPFITLLHAGVKAGMNSRVTSLLDVVGLRSRAVEVFDQALIQRLCREEINWEMVDARLKKYRKIGQQFIKDALV